MLPPKLPGAVSAISLLAASFQSLAAAQDLTGYEYIVVGSGAGGGPLAARLALAGHSTLLIEAGNDQGDGSNTNYSVPAFSAKSSEDPSMAWNFFVRHYEDDERQGRDFKTSYLTEGGGLYTGLSDGAPDGAEMLGTLYPRTGTLGGCTAHNALIAVYPHEEDFEHIADVTGDETWRESNMRRYFERLEKNGYLLTGVGDGHGHDGWLSTETAPLELVVQDAQFLSLLTGGAFALGNETDTVIDLASLVAGDANADAEGRDSTPAYYQIPLSTEDGTRTGSREFVVAVRDAADEDGEKMYPLDVRMNCLATKVLFDEAADPPTATGVEFLDGEFLYRASPMATGEENTGTPGTATASREVILAGGTYNSPQLLKLSGVGPARELSNFSIPIISDLPGVGANLQDHYEISVQGRVPSNFTALEGCTWGFGSDGADPCLQTWEDKSTLLGNRGIYSSSGLAAAMFYASTAASDEDYDVFVFGGPVNFRGYFPNYSYSVTAEHDVFSWAILKAHPRNTAGSVVLKSADPRDVPAITYNYFDAGVGDYEADLQAMYEAVELARDAFARQPVAVEEVLPGADVVSQEDIETYVKDAAWGHHASSTCPIGADDDPMAVLDSNFRVRGVGGLRVVDASVYPRIPGTFTAISTYMVAEKAADAILSELGNSTTTRKS
ncbi:Glucose-methanol-choline oxidoreductase [Zalerion maritima]|uniref:Glucose-methanol-choline oxidoreductase n=1 Tax=Zalerion maritima TaxID=339359 RepID=A0AAD5WN30_9PEZI|nr:Glucose-methanol-choline oxidoreductase [Zalerion maritima]